MSEHPLSVFAVLFLLFLIIALMLLALPSIMAWLDTPGAWQGGCATAAGCVMLVVAVRGGKQ